MDRTGQFPYDLIHKMGELGLLGLPFSEEYGGAGADFPGCHSLLPLWQPRTERTVPAPADQRSTTLGFWSHRTWSWLRLRRYSDTRSPARWVLAHQRLQSLHHQRWHRHNWWRHYHRRYRPASRRA